MICLSFSVGCQVGGLSLNSLLGKIIAYLVSTSVAHRSPLLWSNPGIGFKSVIRWTVEIKILN